MDDRKLLACQRGVPFGALPREFAVSRVTPFCGGMPVLCAAPRKETRVLSVISCWRRIRREYAVISEILPPLRLSLIGSTRSPRVRPGDFAKSRRVLLD
jgi:hypothetical protein